MKRIALLVVAAFAVFTLIPSVFAQGEDQKGVIWAGNATPYTMDGKGGVAVQYNGPVHVQIYAASPQLKKKAGDDPVASEDLPAAGNKHFTLPVGKYEVDFSIRDGVDMKTTIKTVVVQNNDTSVVMADFSAAKTLTYGSGMTAQQMEGVIRELARRLIALQAEVDALKGSPKAVPAPLIPTGAPAPTDTSAK